MRLNPEFDGRMAFVPEPEGQHNSSQTRSAWGLEFGHLERVTRGDLSPKAATGFSPGFQLGALTNYSAIKTC
jgi:hypothetical protein